MLQEHFAEIPIKLRKPFLNIQNPTMLQCYFSMFSELSESSSSYSYKRLDKCPTKMFQKKNIPMIYTYSIFVPMLWEHYKRPDYFEQMFY